QWVQKAAEQGDAGAQLQMGWLCAANKDEKAAFEWYKQAAERGLPLAESELGISYLFGRGVAQDLQRGFEWLKKAVENGCADAQYHLGKCYERGVAVPGSPKESLKWFQRAAKQGHKDAQ